MRSNASGAEDKKNRFVMCCFFSGPVAAAAAARTSDCHRRNSDRERKYIVTFIFCFLRGRVSSDGAVYVPRTAAVSTAAVEIDNFASPSRPRPRGKNDAIDKASVPIWDYVHVTLTVNHNGVVCIGVRLNESIGTCQVDGGDAAAALQQ